MPSLVIQGEAGAAPFALKNSAATLGRGMDNDFRLKDIRASRRHCQIVKTPDGHKIVDMESGNGTWVNGVRVKEETLKSGDLIRIGQTILAYVTEEKAAVAAKPGAAPLPAKKPAPAPARPVSAPPPPPPEDEEPEIEVQEDEVPPAGPDEEIRVVEEEAGDSESGEEAGEPRLELKDDASESEAESIDLKDEAASEAPTEEAPSAAGPAEGENEANADAQTERVEAKRPGGRGTRMLKGGPARPMRGRPGKEAVEGEEGAEVAPAPKKKLNPAILAVVGLLVVGLVVVGVLALRKKDEKGPSKKEKLQKEWEGYEGELKKALSVEPKGYELALRNYEQWIERKGADSGMPVKEGMAEVNKQASAEWGKLKEKIDALVKAGKTDDAAKVLPDASRFKKCDCYANIEKTLQDLSKPK